MLEEVWEPEPPAPVAAWLLETGLLEDWAVPVGVALAEAPLEPLAALGAEVAEAPPSWALLVTALQKVSAAGRTLSTVERRAVSMVLRRSGR